jgi:hypothetical protein
VDEAGLGSCRVSGFGSNIVLPLDSAKRWLVDVKMLSDNVF